MSRQPNRISKDVARGTLEFDRLDDGKPQPGLRRMPPRHCPHGRGWRSDAHNNVRGAKCGGRLFVRFEGAHEVCQDGHLGNPNRRVAVPSVQTTPAATEPNDGDGGDE